MNPFKQFVQQSRDEARKLAKKLGFYRDGSGTGTSILIIDTAIKTTDVIAGVEDWWWPRMKANLLEVDVIDESGALITPAPGKRLDLKPFITAYEVATGSDPDDRPAVKRYRFRDTDGNGSGNYGSLGALAMGEEDAERCFGEEYEMRLNTVALVRSPLMVVGYFSEWRAPASAPPSVGCFVAEQNVDFVLKLSEPPDHSRWAPNADRLLKHGEGSAETVSTILKRIRNNFKRFMNDAKPAAPPKPRRLAKLERDLASWFGVGRKGPPPAGEPNPAPISLVPTKPKLSLENGMLTARGTVEIKLAPNEEEGRWFRLRLALNVAEEDGVSSSDPVELEWSSVSELKDLQDGFLLGRVEKGQPVHISYLSAPYDAGWTVRFLPEVLPVEEGASS